MENKNKIKLSEWLKKVTADDGAISFVEESEDRIVKAYKELLSGYGQDSSQILNETARVEEYEGLVIETNINFTSICPHHFLPFFGTVDVAYEPDKIITGLGKIPRLVQVFSRRFNLQEFLVRDIAKEIQSSINAKGVYVRAKGVHLCMCARGPLAQNTQTICSYALGSLKDSDKLKEITWS